METLTTAFTTGLGTISTNVMAMMGTAAPIALSIAGAVLAMTIAWSFFRHLVK